MWRPVLILLCFILGFVAFRYIIISGTLLDPKVEPRWTKENDDLLGVRKAMERGDPNEAERVLRKLLEHQPHYGAAHERLGYVLLQKHQLKEALEHYQIAGGYHPDHGEITRAIAIIKRRLAGGPAREE